MYIIGIAVISFILIILLNLSHHKWLKYSAIITLISSICALVLTAVISIFNNMYLNVDYSYIFKVVSKFINSSYIITGTTLGIVIIILILDYIFKKKRQV